MGLLHNEESYDLCSSRSVVNTCACGRIGGLGGTYAFKMLVGRSLAIVHLEDREERGITLRQISETYVVITLRYVSERYVVKVGGGRNDSGS